ncbi:MAG: 5'-nucleotidase C-terminal domain-containing protein [Bacilli bacterium]
MKKTYLFFSLALLLSSCSLTSPSSFLSDSVSSSEDSSSASQETSVTESTEVSVSEAVSDSVSNSSPEEISVSDSTEKELPDYFTIFSFNDLHGSYSPYNASGNTEVGIARLKYAIENDSDYDPETSIIVSGGDSYQGSYEGYYDKNLGPDLLSSMGVKAMALGNHEFDWGIDTLTQMIERSKDYFPVLACNIIENSTRKPVGFVEPSTIITTDSGVKIGIVGAIGSSETSSIKTSIIEKYYFSAEASYVENELDKMKDCDFTFFLVHDSINDSGGYIKKIIDSVQDDGYNFSGIIGAHSHAFEAQEYSGIPFVQASSNSRAYGKMKFNTKTKEVVNYQYVGMTSADYYVDNSYLDQDIINMIESNDAVQTKDIGLGVSIDAEFNRYNELYSFIPKSFLYEAEKEGWKGTNPMIAIQNQGGIRDSVAQGELTRAKLFKATPFDNKVRIVQNIKGSVISSIIGSNLSGRTNLTSNYCYATSDDKTVNSSAMYDIVAIDYCYESTYFTRKNIDRDDWVSLKKNGSSDWVVPDILIDYVLTSGKSVLNAADYSTYA